MANQIHEDMTKWQANIEPFNFYSVSLTNSTQCTVIYVSVSKTQIWEGGKNIHVPLLQIMTSLGEILGQIHELSQHHSGSYCSLLLVGEGYIDNYHCHHTSQPFAIMEKQSIIIYMYEHTFGVLIKLKTELYVQCNGAVAKFTYHP